MYYITKLKFQMKKLMPFLVSFIFIAFCFSCYENEVLNVEAQKEVKTEKTTTGFRSEEYTPISKTAYLALSETEKANQWLSKMNYLLNTQTLNTTQTGLIEDLIDALETSPIDYDGIDAAGLGLVGKFSETDFINSFATLEANTLTGTNTPTCTYCSVAGGNLGASVASSLDDCNCDWTCGDDFASSSCVNPDCCEPTSSGCGFLWASPCSGNDSL